MMEIVMYQLKIDEFNVNAHTEVYNCVFFRIA